MLPGLSPVRLQSVDEIPKHSDTKKKLILNILKLLNLEIGEFRSVKFHVRKNIRMEMPRNFICLRESESSEIG